jgi:hypothetical protein
MMKRKQTAFIVAGLGMLGLLSLMVLRVLDTPGRDVGSRKVSLTGTSRQEGTNAPKDSAASLEQHRSLILKSPFGTAPIEEVLRALGEATGGARRPVNLPGIGLAQS